ncbi:MAG: hypothetical protein MI976_14305 [Pseudomonadales bacterium]|nr:hypothetical protein [Pseudomonadales bacterium]
MKKLSHLFAMFACLLLVTQQVSALSVFPITSPQEQVLSQNTSQQHHHQTTNPKITDHHASPTGLDNHHAKASEDSEHCHDDTAQGSEHACSDCSGCADCGCPTGFCSASASAVTKSTNAALHASEIKPVSADFIQLPAHRSHPYRPPISILL